MKRSTKYLFRAGSTFLLLCLYSIPSFALDEYETYNFKSHKRSVTSNSFEELRDLENALIEWRTKIGEDKAQPESMVTPFGNYYKLEVTDLVPEAF